MKKFTKADKKFTKADFGRWLAQSDSHLTVCNTTARDCMGHWFMVETQRQLSSFHDLDYLILQSKNRWFGAWFSSGNPNVKGGILALKTRGEVYQAFKRWTKKSYSK